METTEIVSGDGIRPTFVSGGVQPGRIVDIYGEFEASNGRSGLSTATGPFAIGSGDYQAAGSGSGEWRGLISFSSARAVKTGEDNAPTNISSRLWRRVA